MAKLKRPAKVRIKKGVEYDIFLFQSDLLDGQVVKGPQGLRHIFLNEKLTNKESDMTLLHEIVHALDFEYKIGLTEKQVLKLESALYYFLTKNKEIFT